MQRNCFRLLSLCLHTWLLLYAVSAYYTRDFPLTAGDCGRCDAFCGVMVLFRDRFRLVAPSSGTKFAHALIKYRLSQMSLHRIHHPPQKAGHDARKVPLSPPRPKPIGALCPVPQLFAQFTCFPLASGWGISSITSMLGATFTFRLALLLPDSCCNFPVWSNFHFLACFAPTGFLLQLPRLEQPSPFCLLCSY